VTDEHPAARQTAAMPLAWMRRPRAAAALRRAYLDEADMEEAPSGLNRRLIRETH
jgi:hypothetical protein